MLRLTRRIARAIFLLDDNNATRYYMDVIKSFTSSEAAKIYDREGSKKLPPSIQNVALRKLLMIDAAVTINDLRAPPANRLEKLKGSRNGQHSIRINDQWRICFRWVDGGAYDVEIIDYH